MPPCRGTVGFGLALGLSSILMFGVGITTGLRKSREKKA